MLQQHTGDKYTKLSIFWGLPKLALLQQEKDTLGIRKKLFY